MHTCEWGLTNYRRFSHRSLLVIWDKHIMNVNNLCWNIEYLDCFQWNPSFSCLIQNDEVTWQQTVRSPFSTSEYSLVICTSLLKDDILFKLTWRDSASNGSWNSSVAFYCSPIVTLMFSNITFLRYGPVFTVTLPQGLVNSRPEDVQEMSGLGTETDIIIVPSDLCF